MHGIIKNIVRLSVFLAAFSLSFNCGELSTVDSGGGGAIGTTGQAASVLPANLPTQPWLCAPSTWNPMTAPWAPMLPGPGGSGHGWCQWQPQPEPSLLAYRVQRCTTAAGARGTIDVYSEQNQGGACARLQGAPAVGNLYRFDTDLFQVNGWLSIWLSWDGSWQSVTVKSIRIPEYTHVTLCEGPQSDVQACYNRSWDITTGNLPVPYANMIWNDGSTFVPAAVAVGRSF